MIPPAALDCLYGLARRDAFGGRWFRVAYGEREEAMARRVLEAGTDPWPWTLAGGMWSAVAGQGDMDSTCAMAGGVIAARTGVAGLPPAWRAAAEPLPGWVPRPPGAAGSPYVAGPVRS